MNFWRLAAYHKSEKTVSRHPGKSRRSVRLRAGIKNPLNAGFDPEFTGATAFCENIRFDFRATTKGNHSSSNVTSVFPLGSGMTKTGRVMRCNTFSATLPKKAWLTAPFP